MEAKFQTGVAGDQNMSYTVVSNAETKRFEMPVHSTSDAVTVPTRRQMNSVKNQFEGKILSYNIYIDIK